MAMEENCKQSSSASDAFTRAFNLLVQGKRHILVADYSSAVQTLGEACQILDESYEKGANECGDAYLFYGIALLELARQETGALDGVVNAKLNESEEEDEDESDAEEDENEEAGESSAQAQSNDESEKKTDTEEDIAAESPKEDGEEKPETEKIDNQNIGESSKSNNVDLDVNNAGPSQASTSKGNEEENGEEAEVSDLEIAFDVLTMASIIYRRQSDKGNDMKLKLAESLQKLGEVSIEWENNELAVTLLGESLELRKECLSEDDRLIAETYYHIGIAYSFMKQVEKANDCYRSAIEVITKRIESRKKLIEESVETEEKSKAETEIWELESLLPEMRAKIEDSQDQMLSTISDLKKNEESELMEERLVAEKMKEVKSKPINNVTHLVKRKRKEDSDPPPVAKKACSSDNKEISSEINN